jgi:hypothetical protein
VKQIEIPDAGTLDSPQPKELGQWGREFRENRSYRKTEKIRPVPPTAKSIKHAVDLGPAFNRIKKDKWHNRLQIPDWNRPRENFR